MKSREITNCCVRNSLLKKRGLLWGIEKADMLIGCIVLSMSQYGFLDNAHWVAQQVSYRLHGPQKLMV